MDQSNWVHCSDCGAAFYKQGYYRHKGSKLCKNTVEHRPFLDEIEKLYDRLIDQGKDTIPKYLVNAIKRRGLEEFVGLEEAHTGYNGVAATIPNITYIEYWVWDWFKKWYWDSIYANRKSGKNPTDTFYEELNRIKYLPKEKYELIANMKILAQTKL